MPVTINGDGSIAGLSVGGLGNGGIVDADSLASNAVTTAKLANGAATQAKRTYAVGEVVQTVFFDYLNNDSSLVINITSLPSDAKRRIAISIPNVKNFYGGAGAPASTVGGSTRSSGGGIPAGNTNITETGSTYN